MKIKCIKDVVMDRTGETAFMKGRDYKAFEEGHSRYATNEQGSQRHCIKTGEHDNKWFDKHFVKLEEAGVEGVASAEKVINELGGLQSKLDYRFDLIDTKAIFALANVLHHGEVEYGKDNWRKIDVESHLNHATSHIYAYLAGDKQDEHLSHALCRLMMAIGVEKGDI